jgi:transcriptional regulator with XRE-family HTH domain
MTLGEKLLLLIRNKGWTQKYVSKKLGVRPVTVSGYVRNAFLPSVDVLWRLSRLLGVATDYLLDADQGWPPSDRARIAERASKRR